MVATSLSFWGGSVLLTLLVGAEAWLNSGKPGQLPYLRFRSRPSFYHFLPGVFGVAFVTASESTTLVISFVLYFILSTVGFLVTGLLIDHFGWFNAARRPITWVKCASIGIAIVGAIMSALDRLTRSAAASAPGAPPGWLVAVCIICALGAGFLLPLQASINRDVAARLLPSKLQTAWWSFLCGSVVSGVALACQTASMSGGGGSGAAIVGALPSAFDSSVWWMYMGGPLGVLYVSTTIWGVQLVGSAAFFVAVLCGQLVGSATIDAVGLLGGAVTPMTPLRGAGIALVVVAAASLQVDWVAWWRWAAGVKEGAVVSNATPTTAMVEAAFVGDKKLVSSRQSSSEGGDAAHSVSLSGGSDDTCSFDSGAAGSPSPSGSSRRLIFPVSRVADVALTSSPATSSERGRMSRLTSHLILDAVPEADDPGGGSEGEA